MRASSLILSALLPLVSGLASAQTATVEHARVVSPAENYDESGPAADDVFIPWTEQLPAPLRRVQTDSFAPVEGPTQLRADPRGVIPPQPTSLEEMRARFFPTWPWERSPEILALRPEAREQSTRWQPQAGACYAAIAWDAALATWEDRKAASARTLAWWEAGADIDIQVRDAVTGVLIAEDLSRELLPRVSWCSDGREVRIDVRLGVPADAPPEVEVHWGVAIDPQSQPALRFTAGDQPLVQRLRWAQSIVAPRSRALSAPAWFEVEGSALVRGRVPVPRTGCELLVVVGEAGIQDLAVALEDREPAQGDFSAGPMVALPICADGSGADEWRFLVGVRAGEGRVAVQRFSFEE